jgi:succinyl-CoA synthetase beta subunit
MGTEGQFMILHEYQSKRFFSQLATPIPKGDVAGLQEEAI